MLQPSAWSWTKAAVALALLGVAPAMQEGELVGEPPLPYDLAQVRHLDSFTGPPRARDLLARQGFVVTDEQFLQIFEPYLPSSHVTMPVFITVDSAWHTYHVLLEEGVQEVELGQARLLKRFSQKLHQTASARKSGSMPVYRDLAAFAAVGWAAQDPSCVERLPPDERPIVDQAMKAIRTGGTSLFFGLPLQAEVFRPAGFYTRKPELAGYFVARRWYATMPFRLKSEVETVRALYLALLVESDPELKGLYRQLTNIPEVMVGPTDDPGILQYAQLASKLARRSLTEEQIPLILDNFRNEARKFPGPRINDQLLSPEEFAAREEETKGMRVFGSRQSPSAVLFQATTEPVIRNRIVPSGVDVFAAGPFACEAGRRVLKAMEPSAASYEAICRADCGSLPDSLHGRAMGLLRRIHEPLPDAAPIALRTAAWQDKQLWTSLGAWAEERHTWVLHTKPTGAAGCMFEESPGYVSPYPEFYRQLGQLARHAATVLRQVAPEPDLQAAGKEWLEGTEDAWDRRIGAMAEYFQEQGKDLSAANAIERAQAREALDATAGRCLENQGVTEADRRRMKAFLSATEGNAAQLLPDFAHLCDQLAAIAEKELVGKPLDAADSGLIRGYGETLARFHFYVGDTCRAPRDDFSCVAPVFSNPLRNRTLYVGVGRPEAIYVVLFIGKRLVLHRGAVLSYREFPCPLGGGPDDDQWREEVAASRAPSPPDWTTLFRNATSREDKAAIVREAAARVRDGKLAPKDCRAVGHEVSQVLMERLIAKWKALESPRPSIHQEGNPPQHEGSEEEDAEEAAAIDREECSRLLDLLLERAVSEDVPDLLGKLLPAAPADEIPSIFDCVASRDWKPHHKQVADLLHHPLPLIAANAAMILAGSPGLVDVAGLAEAYGRQPQHVRRAYCCVIGQSQPPGPEGKRVLEAGLRDEAWEVRYEAAATVARCRATSPEILAAVRAGVQETHPKVAAAMIHAATALNLIDVAPQIFARLQKQLETAGLVKTDDRAQRLFLGDWQIESLTAEIIKSLGEFEYRPATETLRRFVFPDSAALAQYEFGTPAFAALLRLDPQNKRPLLAAIFRDPRCPDHIVRKAIKAATETADIKYLQTMLPLFEDLRHAGTHGHHSEAVWAARDIAAILEHAHLPVPEAASLSDEIRSDLLRQTHGPAASSALAALQYFDPAAAARECLSVAKDQNLGKNVRTSAIGLLREAPRPWPIRELLPLVNEPSDDADPIPSIAFQAVDTIGTLSRKLDPRNRQDVETWQIVEQTLGSMLKGPRGAIALEGLAQISANPQDLLLRIAGDPSRPYKLRAGALRLIHNYGGPECAKSLIPLLADETRPDDETPTIAQCAADAIADMVGKAPWDGAESASAFLRKAKAWAEAVEPE